MEKLVYSRREVRQKEVKIGCSKKKFCDIVFPEVVTLALPVFGFHILNDLFAQLA